MAVVSVKQLHERRSSSRRNGATTHVRVYLVTCDNPHDGTAVALTADDGTTRIPREGDDYLDTKVTSIQADPHENSDRHFVVTVESTDGDGSFEQPNVHPLDRPAEVTWSSSEATAPYFIDESEEEKAVVNSAGDPFEQFLERETGEMVITVVLNSDYHNANEAEQYSHTVNQDYVTIDGTTFPPGTLKLSPIQAIRVVETWQGQSVTYYRRTFTFKARRQGWDDKVMDVGLNEIVTTTRNINGTPTNVHELKPILDRTGHPVRKPYPLDGEGRKRLNATDKAAELTFVPYTHTTWAALGIT